MSPFQDPDFVVLGGGLGGGRMAIGLQHLGLLERSLVITNIADDHSFYGLHVSPDTDTILYMLAGLIDPLRGWGIRNDTTRTIDSLDALGAATWFHVGDQDMATHLYRTELLTNGSTLTDVTLRLCKAHNLPNAVVPISNDPVRTRVTISTGEEVDFQTYHVRLRAAPDVNQVRYDGIELATPGPGIVEIIRSAPLVVLAPSSPVSSTLPILNVHGVRTALAQRTGRTVAVSPIVLGVTPGDMVASRSRTCHRLLIGAGYEASPHSIAAMYEDLIDTFIVDTIDAATEVPQMPSTLNIRQSSTITPTPESAAALLRFIIG